MAKNGVLFLDEIPEFNRPVIEVLRQQHEDRRINISRVKYTVNYPASFMMVASMNPCPCGFYNHPTRQCVCSPGQVQKYLNRVSVPLMDRIDIQIEIVPVPLEKMDKQKSGEPRTQSRERVSRARQMQEERFKEFPDIHCNAQMTSKLLATYAQPDENGLKLLKNAMERLNLSARAYDRILKVSRTIADLDGSQRVQSMHIGEAIN